MTSESEGESENDSEEELDERDVAEIGGIELFEPEDATPVTPPVIPELSQSQKEHFWSFYTEHSWPSLTHILKC